MESKMGRKTYVFTQTFGEYDSAEKVILAVLSGPDDVNLPVLRPEYCEYVRKYDADLKARRKELPLKERRKLKREIKLFWQWAIEVKGFEKLEFQEIEW